MAQRSKDKKATKLAGAFELPQEEPKRSAVPEPAAVAMLLAGLGVIGAVVRRQRAG